MKSLGVMVCAFALFSVAAWCDEQHHHQLSQSEVGSVHFATSCAKAVEQDFKRRRTAALLPVRRHAPCFRGDQPQGSHLRHG